MTKKLTWEVDKTSLVLKVTDGAKETTWKLRKTSKLEDIRTMLEEMQLALWEPKADNTSWARIAPNTPMIESVRTVDAEELIELQRQYPGSHETSEEDSRAAQAETVAALQRNAGWMNVDEDEIYTVQIPDYDTGEVRPR
jgi:hypothetical protein